MIGTVTDPPLIAGTSEATEKVGPLAAKALIGNNARIKTAVASAAAAIVLLFIAGHSHFII